MDRINRKVQSLLLFFFFSNLASNFGALGSGATIATSLPPGDGSVTSHFADMKLARETPDLNDLKLPHLENLPTDLKEQKED